MLGKWHQELLSAMLPQLREQMREGLSEHWLTAGYALFAVDGSRVALARTESLEAAFAPRRGRTRAASQWNGATLNTTIPENSNSESSTVATVGKAVWNTVTTVAYGTGVLTGAALLWGAAEVAKRMLTNRAAATEEQQ